MTVTVVAIVAPVVARRGAAGAWRFGSRPRVTRPDSDIDPKDVDAARASAAAHRSGS